MKEWDNTEKIINKVFSVSLKQKTRERPYVEARAVFYKIMREVYKKQLNIIGNKTGRNHATVIHGITNAKNWILFDEGFREKYNYVLHLVDIYNETFERYMTYEDLVEENDLLKEKIISLTLNTELLQDEADKLNHKGSKFEKLFNRIQNQFSGTESLASNIINKFLNGLPV